LPLSEDEQRILHEIERSFYENDPAFAREVRGASLTRMAARNCKIAALTFIVSLVVLVFSFASVLWLGALSFLLMLGSALGFITNLRKLGRGGWPSMGPAVRGHNINDMFGDTRKRLRERFRRDRRDR
jgi:hypothetical protein